MSKITCFRCDKNGHFATSCPDRILKLHDAYENKEEDTKEADRLMMHEVVYLNEKTVNRRSSSQEWMDGDKIW